MKKITLFTLFSICLLQLSAQILPPCFKKIGAFGVDLLPSSITSGDFNSDGKLDLAIANYSSNNVSVLLGNGTGSFVTAVNFTAGSGPSAISCADFNGDNVLDLAVTNSTGNNISMLLGNGNGTFGGATNYGSLSQPNYIIAEDFNGDGKKDVALTNHLSGLVVLLGNGMGGLGTATVYSTFGLNPSCVQAGDLNNDGKTDLVVSNKFSDNLSVFFGNGLGAFTYSTSFNCQGLQPVAISLADFNGDSMLDVASVNTGGGNVSVFLGTSGGTFSFVTSCTTSTGPRSIVSRDFNNDGKIDFIVCANSGSLVLYTGSGNGTFLNPLNYSIGLWPVSLTSGDFNNDGLFDIASANMNGNDASVFLNFPLPTISITGSGTVCAGNSVTLSATGAITYSWVGGPSTASNVVFPSVNTTYSVIGTNSLGCSSVSAKSLQVIFTTINILPPNLTICAGETTTLSLTGATNYTWSNGVTSNSQAITPLTTSTYSAVGIDSYGCKGNSANIVITVDACLTVQQFKTSDHNLTPVVYPNPCFENCFLKNIPENSTIKVCTSFGEKLVEFRNNLSSQIKIDILLPVPGLYFIEVTEPNLNIKTVKFLKE